MLAKILKVLGGLVLIPCILAVSNAFYTQVLTKLTTADSELNLFIWGCLAFFVVRTLIEKIEILYVIAHELTHMLAVLLCGGQVKSFQIRPDYGSVTATKTNVFIELSPYLIPLYPVLLCFLWWIFSFLKDISIYKTQFIFLMGFTITLHLASTVSRFKIIQKDILGIGRPLSYILIYTINILLVGLCMGFLFPDVSARDFVARFIFDLGYIYPAIYRQLFFA